MWPSVAGFSLIAAPVEVLDSGLEYGAYRNAVQGRMKPHLPLPEFLKALSELGGTHHCALAYGVDAEGILAFGRMMDFATRTI